MDQLLSYLPPFEGLLPKWLLLVSVVTTVNSFQAYRSTKYTAQLYTNGQKPASGLSTRLFSTWTLLSAVVRLTAAYNITTPVAYDLAAWTYGIALVHFIGELVVGDASLHGRFVSPLIVAPTSLVWMLAQREAYLNA